MAEKIGKAQRWLDLVVFLLRHRLPVTVERIMENVPGYAGDWATEDETKRANVRRKFERDKDELRALGIPIETVEYTVSYGREELQGYRLKPKQMYLPNLVVQRAGEADSNAQRPAGHDWKMPTVRATPQTWSAFARAARRVADMKETPLAPFGRSALRKLGFDLPDVVEGTEEPYVHYLGVPEPSVRDALAALTPAVLARKEVRFDYYSISRDERRPRRAQPYGLFFQGGHWYLIGRDPEADGLRTFRLSRMDDVQPKTKKAKKADFEVPGDFRLRDYVGREAWRLGEDESQEVVAEVLFLPPTSWWAESQDLGEYVRADEATGGQVRAFSVRQPDPFLRWCLTFQGQARPLAPRQLVDGFRDLVRRVLALYEGGAGEDGGGGGGDE